MKNIGETQGRSVDGDVSKLTFRRICIAFIPLAALIGMILIGVAVFGRDVGDGASQISLVFATALASVLAIAFGRVSWRELEHGIASSLSKAGISIMILFFIGMLSGAWMIGGVVPTLICYGVKIMNPNLFLMCACIICAIVSLMTGTSWTTVATIGVALLGIGTALGIPAPWSAGAIISGAYFGDKLSPLSDTTILASSSTGTDLFVHIRYMLFTTIPSMTLTLIIFLVAGSFLADSAVADVEGFTEGLSRTFNITPWTLLVPVATGILIALRLPSLAVLFISALLGGVSAVILQSDVLLSVVGEKLPSAVGYYKALMTTFFTSTHIDAGSEALNRLVSTRGMSGMLTTVWLIICAVSFGGVMYAGGMLKTIADVALACVRGLAGLVGATAFTGALMNVAAGDQYISILITADMFRDAYRGKGLETRLLSRTIEDSSTVTSVLVPWNTCAMAQSASLGMATVAYLPFCFFNLISPFMSVIVAATGWKIVQPKHEDSHAIGNEEKTVREK
jgi:NhaC family Na+:H+ antiporter